MQVGVECLRALQLRTYYETGEWVDDETLVMNIMPADSEIKREEIFQIISRRYGKVYDNDGVHAAVDKALSNLCEKGTIKKLKHGIYVRVK